MICYPRNNCMLTDKAIIKQTMDKNIKILSRAGNCKFGY